MTNYRSAAPRIRLFRNDLLERFTLISPPAFAVTWTIFLSCAVYASWRVVSFGMAIVLVALGLLIWTLFEYAMHRFIFHLKLRSEWWRKLIFITHGNHHTMPGDRYRNIMPPVVSVGISGMIWILFYALFGAPGSVLFLGFGIGYVVYDVIHYACHQLPMRGPLLRKLRQHHIRHHYAKQEGNFAITAIVWDHVFGTYIPTKKK
ncbi:MULTISPECIES: sterol desaturase family protein [unclassified Sphingomonas]|uniref:sterol desaturase family protein n=1 Tax=unclassified Sphingomonas TaxID=196159 RepID=UPI001F59923E|nr:MULTISPECIES: sterol desaturase family protein [unclassified Sphingomonas]